MDDTFKALSQKTADGSKAVLYAIDQDTLQENMEIRYGKDHPAGPQPKSSPPIGLVKFRFISSKMELTLHGGEFYMKRKTPIGGHFFQYPGLNHLGEMQWKSSTFMGSGLKLVDRQGRTIACTKKELGGLLGGGPCAFHIFDRIDDGLFMDIIAVTGLAAIEYRRQADEGWDWLKDIFG